MWGGVGGEEGEDGWDRPILVLEGEGGEGGGEGLGGHLDSSQRDYSGLLISYPL